MDDLAFLLKGVAIGLSIAAPVGPIGLLCIRRTLADGPVHGFVSGLGAASADAVYGAIAGFGLAAVADTLLGWETALRLVGGVVLLWLGVATMRAKPAGSAAATRGGRGLLMAYAGTFVLTLANPATILSFLAVFGGLGLAAGGGSLDAAAALVIGVFAGSALWWLGLCVSVGLLRRRMTSRAMTAINVVSGGVLVVFGLAALSSVVPITAG